MIGKSEAPHHGKLTARLAIQLQAAYGPELTILHDHRNGERDEDKGRVGKITAWLGADLEAAERGTALSQLDVAVVRDEGSVHRALVLIEIEESAGKPKTVLGDAFATLLSSSITFHGEELQVDRGTVLLLLIHGDQRDEPRLHFLNTRIQNSLSAVAGDETGIRKITIERFSNWGELESAARCAIEATLHRAT